MSAIIALDLGSKNVGVARSLSGLIAEPVGVWPRRPETNLLAQIRDYAESYEVDLVVIGRPTNINDKQLVEFNKIAAEIKRLGIQTILVNEDFSTKEARQRASKPKKRVGHADATAAQVILERYLEEAGNEWQRRCLSVP